jgi:hypothetical protein
MPSRQAPAAHWQDQAIRRAAQLLHHLDRDRGLPLDHVRVVEGRQEMRPGLRAFRLGRRQRLVEEVAGQHDLDGIAAEGLGLQDLLLGRRHGHVDPPRHPEMRADEGHPLRVVARTGADEARGGGIGRADLAHRVEGAADLVGPTGDRSSRFSQISAP